MRRRCLRPTLAAVALAGAIVLLPMASTRPWDATSGQAQVSGGIQQHCENPPPESRTADGIKRLMEWDEDCDPQSRFGRTCRMTIEGRLEAGPKVYKRTDPR